MFDYSVAPKPNPRDREAVPKFYAMAQCRGIVNLDQFAKHIATHGCVYKRADIAAVLTMAVDCLKEMLLNGYKVELGDMGAFYLSLSSKGTVTAKEFNPIIHVKAVNVNWERGVGFLNLKEEAEFNLVTIRAYQKALLSAVKNGETTVNLLEDKENEEEGGEDLTD
jgi:predicted histone-like DNA-binding protein